MIRLSSIALVVMCLSACAPEHKPQSREAIVEAINHAMNNQQEAWNRADIGGYMDDYWKSDSLLFVGRSGLNKGWNSTLENYKKGYPDASAMGRLQFTNLEMDVLSDRHAYVVGRWVLFRDGDTLGGHYSLLWRNISGKWVIVADHSS